MAEQRPGNDLEVFDHPSDIDAPARRPGTVALAFAAAVGLAMLGIAVVVAVAWAAIGVFAMLGVPRLPG